MNLGCGEDWYGHIRMDVIPSKSTNIVGDAHFLPFRDEVFDEVFSGNLFEHLENPMQSLREQKRTLKLHGRLILITDNASYWRFHIPSKSAHLNYVGRGNLDVHYALFMPFHLENFFNKLKMGNVRIQFLAREKPYGFTGFINYVLRRLPSFKHFGYGRFKVVGFKNSKIVGRGESEKIREGN